VREEGQIDSLKGAISTTKIESDGKRFKMANMCEGLRKKTVIGYLKLRSSYLFLRPDKHHEQHFNQIS
jgi:hypothetical protein